MPSIHEKPKCVSIVPIEHVFFLCTCPFLNERHNTLSILWVKYAGHSVHVIKRSCYGLQITEIILYSKALTFINTHFLLISKELCLDHWKYSVYEKP